MQTVEVRSLLDVVVQAVSLQIQQDMLTWIGVRAALQQFFQQATESAGFDALEVLSGCAVGLEEGGRAEIAEQAGATRIDQQVVGIEVAMQDAAAVQVSNGGRDAAGDAQDLFEAETLLGTVAVARAAGQRGWLARAGSQGRRGPSAGRASALRGRQVGRRRRSGWRDGQPPRTRPFRYAAGRRW